MSDSIVSQKELLKQYCRKEQKCKEYEQKNSISVIRLDDGDGVVFSGEEVTILRGNE